MTKQGLNQLSWMIEEKLIETETPKAQAITITNLMLFTASIALSYMVLIFLGFGDQYYVSKIPNEVRRWGFGAVLAFSIAAIAGFRHRRLTVSEWVGLRVFLLVLTVAVIKFVCLPKLGAEPKYPLPKPPDIYPTLYLIVLVCSVSTTLAAIGCSRTNRIVFSIVMILSMISELWVAFVLMIFAREPEMFFETYQAVGDFSILIHSVGIVAVLMGIIFAFRCRMTLIGFLGSLVLQTIPIAMSCYEWLVIYSQAGLAD